ncbi:MAG: UbiA family prenyltransferase [Candidatus Protistobacter heckmanni]|nr:UbiA family prenyltransferase [Candidatus Protistobacter heckmanni]
MHAGAAESQTPDSPRGQAVGGAAGHGAAPSELPLYVDLDGPLIRTDLLFESALQLLRREPLSVFSMALWLLRGKVHLKQRIADRVEVYPALLPYCADFLGWLRGEAARGRKLYLVSASEIRPVRAVARHLGIFAEALGMEDGHNLKGANKARQLRAHAQPQGAAPDKGAQAGAEAQAARPDAAAFAYASDSGAGGGARGAGAHPAGQQAPARLRERERAGLSAWKHALSPQAGILAAGVLLPLSLVFGWQLSPMFCVVLAAYVVVTLAYSLALKREAFIDVLILAGLYTLHVFAGGVASGIAVSNWLLAISGFLFLSLALVKRCAELEDSLADGREAPSAHGYLQTDLPYLSGMGISSGFVAVLVIALYIDSQNSAVLYARQQLLWLACPLLLAWVMRLWIKTARRQMSDDPVLFALRDRFSWWVGAGVVAMLAGATPA